MKSDNFNEALYTQSWQLFQEFLKDYSSVREAARTLKVSRGCLFVRPRKNGPKRISIEVASKIEQLTNGRFKIEELVPWYFYHRQKQNQ